MRHNPLLRWKYLVCTKDDIYSEAFMIADKIILRDDIPDDKKTMKLWYLFHRAKGKLKNIVSKYWWDIIQLDDVIEDNTERYENIVDDTLEYFLVKNHILTSIESKIIEYLKQWKKAYEISRILNTKYNTTRNNIDIIRIKINDFIKLYDE